MTFTAYNPDPLSNTVGEYEFSEDGEHWHRVRTHPQADIEDDS